MEPEDAITMQTPTSSNCVLSNVAPPDSFDFDNPNLWLLWKKRFLRFTVVSGYTKRSSDEKKDLLLYTMGEKAEEILLQFVPAPSTYEETLERFDQYFIPQKNVTFNRYEFNSRHQKPGENVDSFITALHKLADQCEYGQLKDDLIRDQLILGMNDKRTSEKLQLQSKLTLANAITIARQAEIQGQHSQILWREKQVNIIHKPQEKFYRPQQSSIRNNHNEGNTLRYPPTRNKKQITSTFRTRESTSTGYKRTSRCYFCDSPNLHQRRYCPARNATCNKCSKQGHWSKACRYVLILKTF